MRYRDLTRRQQEIVSLLADGLTNDEIGAALYISPGTVKGHISRVYQLVGVVNRVQLARWYWTEVQLPFYLRNGYDDEHV